MTSLIDSFFLQLFLCLLVVNMAFGGFVMQFTIYGLPLNEIIVLVLLIFTLFSFLRNPILDKTIFLWIVWISISLLVMLPVGLLDHGIYAGRDATNQIDSCLVLVGYYFARTKKHVISLSLLQRYIILALSLEFLDRTVLGPAFFIPPLDGKLLSPFGSTIGSQLAIFTSLALAFFSFNPKKPRTIVFSLSLVLASLVLVLLHQNRFLYFGIILLVIQIFFVGNSNMKYLLSLLVPCVFVVLPLTALIIELLSPHIEHISRLTKYADSSISLSSIFEHLQTSFGSSSSTFKGSSGGLEQRLGWWAAIFDKAIQQPIVGFIGNGFGTPLTESWTKVPIREPHNSYVSVFGRGGIFYLLLWIYLLFTSYYSILNRFMLNHASSIKSAFYSADNLVFTLAVLVIPSIFLTALVEPAFELPPYTMYAYSLIGLSLGLLRNSRYAPINS